jgi:hypothetical protein
VSNENESSSDEVAQVSVPVDGESTPSEPAAETAIAGETATDPVAAETAIEQASEQVATEPDQQSATETDANGSVAFDDVAGAPPASAGPSPAAPSAAEEEDRRRAYRLNKVLGATLTSLSGETQSARLFVIDISCSGFRATDHQPHNEEQYDISVVLNKTGEPFRSRMRVVWTKELTVSGMFQMGCEFVDAPPEELDKLAAFIDKERKKVEPPKPMDLGRPWTMIR